MSNSCSDIPSSILLHDEEGPADDHFSMVVCHGFNSSSSTIASEVDIVVGDESISEYIEDFSFAGDRLNKGLNSYRLVLQNGQPTNNTLEPLVDELFELSTSLLVIANEERQVSRERGDKIEKLSQEVKDLTEQVRVLNEDKEAENRAGKGIRLCQVRT